MGRVSDSVRADARSRRRIGLSDRSVSLATRDLEGLKRELRRCRIPRTRDPRVRVRSRPRTPESVLEHLSAQIDYALLEARLGHRERMFYFLGLVQGMAVMDRSSEQEESRPW